MPLLSAARQVTDFAQARGEGRRDIYAVVEGCELPAGLRAAP